MVGYKSSALGGLSPPPVMPLKSNMPIEAKKEEAKHHTVIEDKRIVNQELTNYEMDRVIDENHLEFDDLTVPAGKTSHNTAKLLIKLLMHVAA
jgi:iron only hydrogenase large subunit-like protein